MNLDLKRKTAVITGPAKGMGAAITRAFAAEGCRLVLVGRDVEVIQPLAAELCAGGTDAIVVQCDLTDALQCDQAAAAAIAAFGTIDILINIAGGSGPIGKTGTETTPAEFDDIITVNMNGSFHIMRSVAVPMMAQRSGKIVNIGGTFGLRGRAGRMAYSASKWGLRGITKSFALELGPYNINVNLVAPGMVDGPRFRTKVSVEMAERLGITPEEAAERHAADYAMRRLTLDTDVANACLFLASDAARQITGIDLPVDGGWALL